VYGALCLTPLSLAVLTPEHGETTPFPNPWNRSPVFSRITQPQAAYGVVLQEAALPTILARTSKILKDQNAPVRQQKERDKHISEDALTVNECVLIPCPFDRMTLKTMSFVLLIRRTAWDRRSSHTDYVGVSQWGVETNRLRISKLAPF
jgi:hypothetical protein